MHKHGPNVWVVRRGTQYSIKEEGRARFLVEPVSQRVAIWLGRRIATENRSELIIQGKNGRIRARDSHGFDPIRSKG